MPGRLELVGLHEIHLTPDIEIKLPDRLKLFERIYDKSGVIFEYDAVIEIPDTPVYDDLFAQGTIYEMVHG